MEYWLTEAKIKRMEALGWKFVFRAEQPGPFLPSFHGYLKFDKEGIPIAQEGDETWSYDLTATGLSDFKQRWGEHEMLRPAAQEKKETAGERDLRLCNEISAWKRGNGISDLDFHNRNLQPGEKVWLADFERRWMEH